MSTPKDAYAWEMVNGRVGVALQGTDEILTAPNYESAARQATAAAGILIHHYQHRAPASDSEELRKLCED